MIIIRCNALIKDEALAELWAAFQFMADRGVILLPASCELLNEVPPDEEIVVIKKGEQHGDV